MYLKIVIFYLYKSYYLITLIKVVKQYIFANNIIIIYTWIFNVVMQIIKHVLSFYIKMILKSCTYLDYGSHWEAICEKCHARMNFVYTWNCLFIFLKLLNKFYFPLIFNKWHMFKKCTCFGIFRSVGVVIQFNKLESSLLNKTVRKAWLKLGQWFKRRSQKCKKFTDGQRDKQTDTMNPNKKRSLKFSAQVSLNWK